MSVDAEPVPRSRRWLAYLPLVVFMALAWLLFERLNAGDPASIPSVLIGQSAPRLDLPGLDGATGLTDADLRSGHVSVVNIFASWCEPCHFEHETLMALAADPSLHAKNVAIYGVAQKDSAENIRRFLGAKGDPYAKVGLDTNGRASIDWGVYGVPETFIVRGDGSLAFKLVGPMTAQTLESEIKPQVLKAMN
jgi:cytochrome c biogenesis protein CcmG/thiol:disulfide interchange protein DsbE